MAETHDSRAFIVPVRTLLLLTSASPLPRASAHVRLAPSITQHNFCTIRADRAKPVPARSICDRYNSAHTWEVKFGKMAIRSLAIMFKIIRKYFVSASFISIALGFLGLYYTLRGTRTHLSMDIAAESNVLDVRHPISDLAIYFQGTDIDEEKANLKILTIRVINDGEASIREGDFDSRIPFGLEIGGGRIIRAQVTGSNSRYLTDNIHLRVEDQSRMCSIR